MSDSTVYDNGNPIGTSLSWHPNGYTADSAVYAADGSGVQGFVCEAEAAAGAQDISHHGGWRAYLAFTLDFDYCTTSRP